VIEKFLIKFYDIDCPRLSNIYNVVIKNVTEFATDFNTLCLVKKMMINRFNYEKLKESELKINKKDLTTENPVSDYKSFFPLLKMKIEENLYDIMKCHYGTYVAHTILEVSKKL
jgi:hypothetical protein